MSVQRVLRVILRWVLVLVRVLRVLTPVTQERRALPHACVALVSTALPPTVQIHPAHVSTAPPIPYNSYCNKFDMQLSIYYKPSDL